MVKEIVPFSKEHFATSVVTLEDFNITLCTWIFVLIDPEFSSGRDPFFDLYR